VPDPDFRPVSWRAFQPGVTLAAATQGFCPGSRFSLILPSPGSLCRILGGPYLFFWEPLFLGLAEMSRRRVGAQWWMNLSRPFGLLMVIWAAGRRNYGVALCRGGVQHHVRLLVSPRSTSFANPPVTYCPRGSNSFCRDSPGRCGGVHHGATAVGSGSNAGVSLAAPLLAPLPPD